MEEPAANEAERELELVMGDESMPIGDNGDSFQSNAMFLIELNLLLVVLSMFALSDEECVNLDGKEKKGVRDHEAKASVTRLQTRRREINVGKEKPVSRRSQRFQTRPKDFRHCRRM
ncbi:hypothetical protein SLA2020_203700 [Shorea laevis]